MTFQDKPIMPVVQALTKVMEEVGAVAKKDRNSAQGFNFRGIDAVVNAVAPALRKYEVVVTPQVLDFRYDNVEVGKNRSLMGHVIVTVKYTFRGAGGDIIETIVLGEAMDSGDKAVPKAMSVAFRTALLQSLALPTDETDPDATSYERSERHTAQHVQPEVDKPKADKMTYDVLKQAILSAANTPMLDFAAKNAATYALSDSQREELRAVFLTRKAFLAGDALVTRESDTEQEVAV